jgi:hypothetical protein
MSAQVEENRKEEGKEEGTPKPFPKPSILATALFGPANLIEPGSHKTIGQLLHVSLLLFVIFMCVFSTLQQVIKREDPDISVGGVELEKLDFKLPFVTLCPILDGATLSFDSFDAKVGNWGVATGQTPGGDVSDIAVMNSDDFSASYQEMIGKSGVTCLLINLQGFMAYDAEEDDGVSAIIGMSYTKLTTGDTYTMTGLSGNYEPGGLEIVTTERDPRDESIDFDDEFYDDQYLTENAHTSMMMNNKVYEYLFDENYSEYELIRTGALSLTPDADPTVFKVVIDISPKGSIITKEIDPLNFTILIGLFGAYFGYIAIGFGVFFHTPVVEEAPIVMQMRGGKKK